MKVEHITFHDRYCASTGDGDKLSDYTLRLVNPIDSDRDSDITPLEVYEAIGIALTTVVKQSFTGGQYLFYFKEAVTIPSNSRV